VFLLDDGCLLLASFRVFYYPFPPPLSRLFLSGAMVFFHSLAYVALGEDASGVAYGVSSSMSLSKALAAKSALRVARYLFPIFFPRCNACKTFV